MKDDSLSINTLAMKNYVCHRNIFQNGINTFAKIVNHFLPKSSKFCLVPTNHVWRDFKTSNVSVSKGSIKCPIGKSIFTVNLPIKLFHATVANADTENLKSLHTLFDAYLDNIPAKFEPNRMIRNVQNFQFFWTKTWVFKTHFRQTFNPILQDLSVAKTIV